MSQDVIGLVMGIAVLGVLWFLYSLSSGAVPS